MSQVVYVDVAEFGGRRHPYPQAVSWKVGPCGELRVLGRDEKDIATYPSGRWNRVSLRDVQDAPEDES